MPRHRISIVRTADRLHELVHEASASSTADEPWRITQRVMLQPHVASPRLAAAWQALACVTAWNDETLRHVTTVLVDTVPSGDDAGELAALGDVEPPAPPRATAAHPRAYRGTKHKPAKPARTRPVDVRGYLLARRHIEQVLSRLGWPAGMAEAQPGADPYLVAHFGLRGPRPAASSLEPWFVTHVLPVLAGSPWLRVLRFAELARAIDAPLRPSFVGVLVAAGERALAWWRHLLALPRDRRGDEADMICASGVHVRDPDELTGLELSDRDRWDVYRGYAGGASLRYLLGGLSLAAGQPIGHAPPGRADVEALVRATIAHLGDAADRDSGPEFWRMQLWRMCGDSPAMAELLPALRELTPPAAFWLARLAASPAWEGERKAARFAALAPVIRTIAAAAAAVPPAYQHKLVEDVADVAWCTVDGDVAAAVARALGIAGRVARPPFTTAPALGDVLVGLGERSVDLLDAPDASLLVLERACRRANDARLVARGLAVLAAYPGVKAAFASHPGALLATADALATMSPEAAREVLAAHARTPLAGELANAPLADLVAAVAPFAGPDRRGPAPIRRALRDHLAGRRALSPAQLAGHRARIVAALPEVRLAAIRQLAEDALVARTGARADTPPWRHALALIHEADENRRPLRRMLIALAGGDVTWRLRHPRTEAWFARHPGLDRARWLAGMSSRHAVPGLGEVAIAVETDPLEVLRAGTYVGTCLGRGGGLTYSAAAIALDANKHVIYARDATGDIVGRQLVGISEADQLVCFSVYAKSHHADLELAFARFDRAFAAALGIPVFAGPAYELAHILSQTWWDDGWWDVPVVA